MPFSVLSRRPPINALNMEIALVVFAVLGSTSASPTKHLSRDLKDFTALLPTEKILEITRWYLDNDSEFQLSVFYLQGEDWGELVAEVAANPIWQKLKANMSEHEVVINASVDRLRKFIAGATPGIKSHGHGIKAFIDELLVVIPTNDLLVLLNEKLGKSVAFSDFWKIISSDDARVLVEEIRLIPEMLRITYFLFYKKIDLNAYFDFVYRLLGWN